MKFSISLFVVAAVMLLVGLGIHMHAEWRYTNKMFYHTVDSTLYEFDEVFAERRIGERVQLAAILTATVGGVWFVVVKLRRAS